MTVKLIGAGLYPFGRWPNHTAADMTYGALRDALQMADITVDQIQAAFCGHSLPGSGGGFAVLNESGLAGIPIFNFDSACASSSTALVMAATAIEAGQWDVALVLGYEKMDRGMIPSFRPHDQFEHLLGLDMQPPRYALKAQRYLADYGGSLDNLASVTVKSRRQASANPNAQFRDLVTLEDVLGSPMIADPLTRFQCCPTTDGAAALILVSGRLDLARSGVTLAGWAVGSPSGQEAPDAGAYESTTARLAQEAYTKAGLGPEHVKVAQVHDAFTIGEVIRSEAIGICPVGEGAEWAARGETGVGGSMPINTDGGLLSRGHPLGATGAAQLTEVFLQMTGRAGPRQVMPAPTVGVCQNTGGGENAATVVEVLVR